MKTRPITHLLAATLMTGCILTFNVHAEESNEIPAPPSTEGIPNSAPKYSVKTETIYEPSFLPGVRLCNEEEVDYRGDFRKVNCQDEQLINSVSTRKDDPYNTRPNAIVEDRVEPNGNIFRLNFRRKATVVTETPDN